jgi:hypothetical protein
MLDETTKIPTNKEQINSLRAALKLMLDAKTPEQRDAAWRNGNGVYYKTMSAGETIAEGLRVLFKLPPYGPAPGSANDGDA